ncbi:MAG: DNA alkylation repair protein [Acidimicrobiia bacterium]|nr:DNA alkylation repair protein [Acidimicrobiia bacterium]
MERIEFVRRELGKVANAENAKAMAAYMKTDMPFFGVKRPERDSIFKEMTRRYPVETRREYDKAVKELWSQPHREEKYLAIAVARKASDFITPPSLPLYRKLIVEGSWWDFVDDVAANLVGPLLLDHRPRFAPVMERWIDDRDMWIRRSALLAHLKHKAATDEETLFDHCLRRAAEPEFFIRKAIGWVLREYAKTAPEAVAEFVLANRDVWSGLTFREATKHLSL